MRAGGAGQARGASEGELKGGMVGDKKEGVREARVEPSTLWLKCAGASPAVLFGKLPEVGPNRKAEHAAQFSRASLHEAWRCAS